MTLSDTWAGSVDFYDRLAPRYDRRHMRWLRYAGGEAQAALEAAVRALDGPGAQVLDVGCGTGAFARRLVREGVCPSRLTLVDPSDAMLARCGDIPALKVQAPVESLPFAPGRFDIVTCAWVLETVPDPELALDILCDMVRPSGVLCLVFCADRPARDPLNWLIRQALTFRGGGRFLAPSRVQDSLRRRGFGPVSVPCSGTAAVVLARRIG